MLKDLKIVFMGTPSFAVPILDILIKKCRVIGVVTQPDKYVGRKHELSYSPIKKLALENNIKVLQPIKIRKDYQEILDLKPDIIITCAYGQIIPLEILNYPMYGCINVHASLLPKLRGGAPIHHAIIDGYDETGITIMYMDSKMDSGDIISQEKTKILDSDNLESLHDRLSIMGRDLLIKTLPSIVSKTNKRIKQNESEVTFGYNIKREEEQIDFTKGKKDIFNQIRGLSPFPGGYIVVDSKIMKIYDSCYLDDLSYKDKENGCIVKVSKNGIYIKVRDGLIVLLDIKMEGKKRMLVEDFVNGNKDDLVGKVVNYE